VDSTRVDKWLWAIRLYRTRTAAGDACRAGHVAVNGDKVKPAAAVRVGDVVRARVGDRVCEVEVLAVLETRVGAKVAVECYVDRSPPPPPRDPAALLELRDPGAGRPTKRDRREMERLKGRRAPGG
jgi:ribosome-associated heat shock protein Hsp15